MVAFGGHAVCCCAGRLGDVRTFRVIHPNTRVVALLNPFSWLREQFGADRTSDHMISGIPTVVVNTRPDISTADVVQRLTASLAMIEEYTPHYFRHLRRDFDVILVQRYACRGAYLPTERACLVELTFVVNRSFPLAQVAATILHEAMHARLHRLGFPLAMEDRARQERFCRRAEIEFGTLAPEGDPVVERALAALQASDQDVAPHIDPELAARRVAQVDRDARDV